MKKFKKLISMVCSLALCTSMVVMPNTANAAIEDVTILEKNSTLQNMSPDIVATPPEGAGGYGAATYVDEYNQLVVLDYQGYFPIGAYYFDEVIPARSTDKYTISFDFKTSALGEYARATLDYAGIENEAYNHSWDWQVANTWTRGFTLAAFTENLKVCGQETGITIAGDTWFSYTMDLDLLNSTMEVTVVEKDNPEAVVQTYTGIVPSIDSTSRGWNPTVVYDKFRVSSAISTTYIDNILITTEVDTAKYLDVKSEDKTTQKSYVTYCGVTYCNDETESMAHFLDWQGVLSTGGWALVKPISGADLKTYEVKFDFNIKDAAHYTTAMLGLAGETNAGWGSSPATYSSGYKLWEIVSDIDGEYIFNWGDTVYTTSKWYSMTAYISPEMGYERKIITERETGNVVADTGWVALDTSATGFLAANTYDKLRFTANYTTMDIDNASVYEVDFPVSAVNKVTPLADGVEQAYVNTYTNAIKVEFTKAMDKEAVEASGVVSLTNANFTFGEWSEDNTSVILNLTKAFEDDTTYTLTVSKDAGILEDATYTFAVDNTLVEADIDNTNPTPYQQLPAGEPRWWTVSEEDGNKYMNLKGSGNNQAGWDPTWGAAGYMFARPMSADNDYIIDFDFRMNVLNGYDGFVISNTDYTDGTWKDRTSLITGHNLAPLSDIGTFEGNIEWSAEKWYSYHAELTDGNIWNVTVTDKADATKTATLTGTVAYDTFDRIAAVADADIDLDNIKIEEVGAEAPAVVSVGFGGATFPSFTVITQILPNLSIDLAVTNTTDTDETGMFMAVYYAGNRLLGMNKADFTVPAGTEEGTVNVTVTLDATLKAQADKITFMAIDDFASFMPYCTAESVSK